MRSRRSHLSAATLVVVLLIRVPAEGAEHWRASSGAAEAITGDVTFSPTKITFAKNVTFPIQFVGKVPGLTWMPGSHPDVSADLYRVTERKNPLLLNDNKLCGEKPPTYISVAREGGGIYLSVYEDRNAPTVEQNSLCAGFDYAGPAFMPAARSN